MLITDSVSVKKLLKSKFTSPKVTATLATIRIDKRRMVASPFLVPY